MPTDDDFYNLAVAGDKKLHDLIDESKAGFDCVCTAIHKTNDISSSGFTELKIAATETPKAPGLGGGQPAPAPPALVPPAAPEGNAVLAFMKDIAGDFLKAVTAVSAAVEGIRLAAEGFNALARSNAQYSPEAIMAYARQDMNQILRQLQISAATADTSVAMAQSVDRMREAWMGFDIAFANVRNEFGRFAADIGTVSGMMATQMATNAGGWVDTVLTALGLNDLRAGGMTGVINQMLNPGNAFQMALAALPLWLGDIRGLINGALEDMKAALAAPAGGGGLADPAANMLWGVAVPRLRR
jgi:hypothetical protein